MEVMEAATDAREIGQQPATDANLAAYWYFMIFILVGAFFILNLIVGVIIERAGARAVNDDNSRL